MRRRALELLLVSVLVAAAWLDGRSAAPVREVRTVDVVERAPSLRWSGGEGRLRFHDAVATVRGWFEVKPLGPVHIEAKAR